MKLLRNKDNIPEVWYKLQEKIEDLRKKYNIHSGDWLDDLWIEIDKNPKVRNLPNDIIQIGGIGVQGMLDFYYSPSQKIYYSECDSATPQKITLPNLWRQIILCLDDDINRGEGPDSYIKFQKEIKSLVQRLVVRY